MEKHSFREPGIYTRKRLILALGAQALLTACGIKPDAPTPSATTVSIIPTATSEPTRAPIVRTTQTQDIEPIPSQKVPENDASHLWSVRSMDTMKMSRDRAREQLPQVKSGLTPEHVTKTVMYVKESGSSHIALCTPYDEEFYPVLRSWVDSSRKAGLRIWYRGNFSSWEGWFDYRKLQNPADHHTMTTQFVKNHPDLFQNGDLFSPAPEPENGVIGDPRKSATNKAQFGQFLSESYRNAKQVLKDVNKSDIPVFYSFNGDVAKELPTDLAQKMGIVLVDHYVKEPARIGHDVQVLSKQYNGVKVGLGEFGAPIPDINGPMSPEQQADYIRQILDVLKEHRLLIPLINYWTIADGSTALVDQNGPRPAYQVVHDYYMRRA
jgi:hypothetical protein